MLNNITQFIHYLRGLSSAYLLQEHPNTVDIYSPYLHVINETLFYFKTMGSQLLNVGTFFLICPHNHIDRFITRKRDTFAEKN